MRSRFGLARGERTDQNRIVVVSICGATTGIIVDSVSEVLRLGKKDIEGPPSVLSSGVDRRFIEGLGKLGGGKRIIILLAVDAILSGQEGQELQSLAPPAPAAPAEPASLAPPQAQPATPLPATADASRSVS